MTRRRLRLTAKSSRDRLDLGLQRSVVGGARDRLSLALGALDDDRGRGVETLGGGRPLLGGHLGGERRVLAVAQPLRVVQTLDLAGQPVEIARGDVAGALLSLLVVEEQDV